MSPPGDEVISYLFVVVVFGVVQCAAQPLASVNSQTATERRGDKTKGNTTFINFVVVYHAIYRVPSADVDKALESVNS